MNPLPWQSVAVKIPDGASINTMLKLGKLDWGVTREPLRTESGIRAPFTYGLIRELDKKFLGVCGPVYEPIQNIVALEKFQALCDYGYMKVEHVGTLGRGAIVWALARMTQGSPFSRGFVCMYHPHICGEQTTYCVMPLMENQGTIMFRPEPRQLSPAMRAGEAAVWPLLKLEWQKWESLEAGMNLQRPTEEQIHFTLMQTFYPKSTDWRILRALAVRCLQTMPKDPSWLVLVQTICRFIDFDMGVSREWSLENAWFGAAARAKHRALKLCIEGASTYAAFRKDLL